jgi:hypothetical protein
MTAGAALADGAAAMDADMKILPARARARVVDQ